MPGPRVMRILTRPNVGGPTRQAISLWHEHRALGIPTLLVTGSVDRTEAVLSPAEHGVPGLTLAEALALGERAEGWVEVPELVRGIALMRDLTAGRQLDRLMRSWRPDVVHTHTSKAGAIGRRIARRARVGRLVHTFHGHVLRDYFGPLLSGILRRGERRRARATARLVAVSPSCADELATLGVAPRERFEVVPPAVETPEPQTRAEARRELGIAADEFRVVAVGRLVPIKRPEHFVAAVTQANKLAAAADGAAASGPTATVFRGDLVGDGPERTRLEPAVQAAGGCLTLRGGLSDVARRMAAWDVLVLSSRREGCPLVAVEAFAAGVPVVGYDVPGVRDVLRDWGGGVLVPESEGPRGLAAALLRLRESAELRAECVAAGLAGLARFQPAAVAAELATLYRAMAPPV